MKAILRITPIDRLMLIDHKTAGRQLQPFEHDYKAVLVVDGKGVEVREYELLKAGSSKYAIHRERINADFPVPEIDQLVEGKFVSAFMRVWVNDKFDYRKAARIALKSIRPSF